MGFYLDALLNLPNLSVERYTQAEQQVFLKLRNARLIFDRFHVMQPVNEALNKVRKQTGMAVKGSKFLLLKQQVDLTEEDLSQFVSILKHSNRLKRAYELKEEFRDIFKLIKRQAYSFVNFRARVLACFSH